MATMRLRSSCSVLLATLCAVVLALSSVLTSAFVVGVEKFVAQLKLLADEGWIMSGTGQPDPTVGPYIGQVEGLYLQPSSALFPGQLRFPGFTFHGLTTPEQFCPFVCIPGQPPLTFGSSVFEGAGLLDQAIHDPLTSGDSVVAFGYSQSATVATGMMNLLQADPQKYGYTPADLANLHAVLIGDPNSPIGGILDRFQFPDGIEPFSLTPAPQHVPFVNIPLSIAPTPTSDFGDGAIYTGEYDGWANFPQDPLNILADINALIGIITVHGFYPAYTADQVASAIHVGTIGSSDFYMIPENLPILQFMFNGGTAGQFFGDFFSPWARLFIDWGYGNAGDPAVDGLYKIPGGAFIEGSPYQQAFGVAGGPWAATPLGELYDGSAFASVADSGIAGFFEKMDPLQMLAGVQNALVQSLIGPWADVAAAANGGTLSPGAISAIEGITDVLQNLTGYNLVNLIDQGVITVWNDVANALSLGDVLGPAALLDGPLIPGQPLLALVGGAFDIFNFFGA